MYLCEHTDICRRGSKQRPTDSPGHEKSLFPESRADPYAAGTGSAVAERCQMEREGAVPVLLHWVLVGLSHLTLHHLNRHVVLCVLLPV